MNWPDFLAIVGIALGTSAVTAVLCAVALVLLRRASLTVQIAVLVAGSVLSVVVAMLSVAGQMYLSEHDLTVGIAVAVVSGVVSLVLTALLGIVVARNSRALRAAARRIGDEQHVDARAGWRSDVSGEFTALAAELVATSARLEESRDRTRRMEAARRELVAWISHDLRTPLAGIRAMAEALEDGMTDDPARYHRQIRNQVDQLSSLVDDLFELSKIDSGTLVLTLAEVSLLDIVSDAVADLGPLAGQREITIEARPDDELTVRADARELGRAVGNLLVNALQHTPVGTPVRVRAHRAADGTALVSVIDSGSGIADSDAGRVFEPGWRGSAARTPLERDPGGSTPRTSGAGLGLAIVRGIAEAHAGGVTVQNVPGGCRFDLILPA